MKKIILNLTAAFLIIFVAACSKKTTTPVTSSAPGEERAGQRGPQRGGDRGARPQFADLLARMDANNDGMLTMAEAAGDEKLKNIFTQVDANQDGFITAQEFENAPRPPRKGGRN